MLFLEMSQGPEKPLLRANRGPSMKRAALHMLVYLTSRATPSSLQYFLTLHERKLVLREVKKITRVLTTREWQMSF